MRLERTPGTQRVALGGDSDLNKAGWLKNKCMKLGLAVSQPSQHVGWGSFSAFSFQSCGQPQAPLPQPKHPCKGTLIPSRTGMTRHPGPMGHLSSCSRAHPQRFQVVWGGGWPPAVQFSCSSWPLLKCWGLVSTFTHGTSAQGWRRAQPPGTIGCPPTGQGSACAKVPHGAEPTLDEEP